MAIQFDPMRSLIYVDCVNEKYRVNMEHWLQSTHVSESISQFEPYVTKYAFYKALPVPADGARFGTVNYQLTEHYWLFNPLTPELKVKTFGETVDVDTLKGAGILPDDDRITNESMKEVLADADSIRLNKTDAEESAQFVSVFVPVAWQEEYKGAMRTMSDGPNYRWQFLLNFPDECSEEEADRWLKEEVFPIFQAAPEVRRILSSKVRKDVADNGWDRVVEIWFANELDWKKVAVDDTKALKKPSWATTDQFPFLKPRTQITSIMLSDYVTSNNLATFGGPIAMR